MLSQNNRILVVFFTPRARRRFRTRIRTVFDKLMRKFGEERLSALVPPEHFKFWSHLVKTRRRDRLDACMHAYTHT